MVHEVTGTEDFRQQLSAPNKLCVVDFTATWCGPCKRVAPMYESLSHKYPDVNFIKVVESTCQDLIMQLGIRAFPTFRFYLGGQQVDDIQGGNIGLVEQKVQAFTAAGGSAGAGAAPPPAPAPAPAPAPVEPDAALISTLTDMGFPEDKSKFARKMVHEVTGTEDFRQQLSAPNKLCVVDFTATWCGPCKRVAPMYENLSHKYPDVNFIKVVESTCQDLITQLGIRAFPTFRFYLGGQQVDDIQGGNIGLVEQKVQAFTAAGGSAGAGAAPPPAPAPAPAPAPVEPDAALMSTLTAMGFTEDKSKFARKMVHEVTGTEDFRQQLSATNKLCVVDFTATWCGPCKRVAPMYENLSHKYPDVNFIKVVESTCQDLITQLGIRAFPTFRFYLGGQQVDDIQGGNIGLVEQKVQAFTAAGGSAGAGAAPPPAPAPAPAPAPVEPDAALMSTLTAMGFTEDKVKEGEESKGAGEAPALSPEEAIDKAIATISKYRTGGDGGVALKTLKAYTSNALNDDPKFRSINMDNNAFMTRVAPFIGGVALLRALGFEKDPAENRLVLPEGGDRRARLQETVAKLEAAMASYQGH